MTYLSKILPTDPPLPISPALAHEIIYGGIDYAARFRFRPHRDFPRSSQILDPPDRHPSTGEVEFGHEGKPLYIEGPHDNAKAILRQLARTAGEGNFDFVVLMSDPPLDWEEE